MPAGISHGTAIALARQIEKSQQRDSFYKKSTPQGVLFSGAGGRTRTGTLSPAVDFESTTSTNSITPAGVTEVLYYDAIKISRVFCAFPCIIRKTAPSQRHGDAGPVSRFAFRRDFSLVRGDNGLCNGETQPIALL